MVLLVLWLAGCGRDVAGGKANGPAVFAEVCARCHGSTGKPPPEMAAQLGVRDLTEQGLHQRMSLSDIRAVVARGKSGTAMPAFTGALTEEQIDAVAAHVHTLGNGNGAEAP